MMDEEEFNRIKDANEAAVFPDRTITKLCASINRLREECGILAVERDDANLQVEELQKLVEKLKSVGNRGLSQTEELRGSKEQAGR